MKRFLFIGLSISIFYWGCTRDDICSPQASKTPLLIISFYNIENPEVRKPADAFTVVKAGDSLGLFTPITTDSIALPLFTGADFTEYFFVTNANDTLPNVDFLTFNYNRQDEFINRACAFRTNFNNLNVLAAPANPQSWIDEIIILKDSINARNQNEAHLNIYH